MPVPEAAVRPSRTPAQAIKQPSNDLYKAQGINPAEQLHSTSDQFVAQNYGSAQNYDSSGNLPPTNVRSYDQPDRVRRDLESGEVDMEKTYVEQPHHAQHYTTASEIQGKPREQNLPERFINKPASNFDAGHDTRNVSDRIPSNVPSTREMVSNLKKGERILEHRKHDTTNAAGDRLIDDLTQVVKDTVNLVEEKNLGDSTRNIIDHSKSMTSKVDTPNINSNNIPNKDVVARDVSNVASQLRRVTQLMITSPAFRGFLWEFYQLSRDTFGPQIDQVVGEKLGVEEQTDRRFDETPTYGQEIRSGQFSATPLSNRNQLNDQFSRNQSYMGSAREVGQMQQSGFAQPQLSSQLAYQEEFAPLLQPTGLTGEQRYSELNPYANDQYGARNQGERFREPAVPQVADDIKHAKNQVLDVKNKVPREKREQLARRWRAMFDEIKEDSRIQEAVRDMKQTLVYLRDKYQPIVQEHKEKVLDAAVTSAERQDEEDVNIVLDESKGLLERFAGGKSLDALINVVNEWYTTIRNDEQLREWLDEFYDYLDTTVHTPETLQDDRHIDKLDDFLLRGQDIFQGRHSELSRRLLDETNDFLYALINDEATLRLRTSVQRVIKDLFLDSEGRFVLKPDLYVQLRKAFMPIVREQLANIGVSHIEEHNDEIDFSLSNIIIDANDISPDQFDIKNVAEIAVGKGAKDGAELHMEFRISAKGATCTVRDVNFYYKKHTFPKLKDSGILDASLTRNGLSFDIDVDFDTDATGLRNLGRRDAAVRNHRRDRDHSMFRVKSCRVDIDKLNLNFREAKHETLYKICKPIIVSKATKAMSHAIEEQLRHIVDELDRAAIQARDQTLATLEKTGVNDRVIRGTEPEQINVGHSHSDRRSDNYNESFQQSDRLAGQGGNYYKNL